MTYKPPEIQHDNGSALVANWTAKERDASKDYLRSMTSKNAANKPTPSELKAIEAFGDPLASIMKNVLKRWHKAMKCAVALQNLDEKNSLRPIRQTEQVHLIMTYLQTYQRLFDSTFGLMEEQSHPPSDDDEHCKVRIRSTGFAAKVFLGIIMADRLSAVIQKRKELRESTGFLPVEVQDLSEDSKDCPICCDELGVPNPEGVQEEPIRLVICCHQVFGEKCLKLWLKENWKTFDRDSCPNCRFKFPGTFLTKLTKDDPIQEKVEDENNEDNDDGNEDDNDEETDGEGSQTDEVEATTSEDSSTGESTTTDSTSSEPMTVEASEEDTPMGNTQVEIIETIEVDWQMQDSSTQW